MTTTQPAGAQSPPASPAESNADRQEKFAEQPMSQGQRPELSVPDRTPAVSAPTQPGDAVARMRKLLELVSVWCEAEARTFEKYDKSPQLARVWIERGRMVDECLSSAQSAGAQEPLFHTASHGDADDVVTHLYWQDADDRTKEWYDTPLYAPRKMP